MKYIGENITLDKTKVRHIHEEDQGSIQDEIDDIKKKLANGIVCFLHYKLSVLSVVHVMFNMVYGIVHS